MNFSISENKKTENTETIKLQKNEAGALTEAGASFSDFMQVNTPAESDSGLDGIIDTDYYFDSVSMDINDALFFLNLAQDGQFSLQVSPEGGFQNIIQTQTAQNMVSQKSIEVTNKLETLIEKAQNTQKPFRISFDNDISVVLKIDKSGKLSAEFIPGSLEAQNYLMYNVSALKQKFDEQNLPYTSLSYRNRNGRNKERNRGEG